MALGRGGLVLVNEKGRPRLPAADVKRQEAPEESAQRALLNEGFIAEGTQQIGKMGGDQVLFWAPKTKPAVNDLSGEIWLPCGGNPVQALRDFATHCPRSGARIYRKAAALLGAHLRKHPLTS
jgi:hypothetical protein